MIRHGAWGGEIRRRDKLKTVTRVDANNPYIVFPVAETVERSR